MAARGILDPTVEPEHHCYARVIVTAKENLNAAEIPLLFQAAIFFFVQPLKKEEYELTSFTGICHACNLDPDVIAERVFKELKPKQQAAIKKLLLAEGYHC